MAIEITQLMIEEATRRLVTFDPEYSLAKDSARQLLEAALGVGGYSFLVAAPAETEPQFTTEEAAIFDRMMEEADGLVGWSVQAPGQGSKRWH